MTQSKDLEITDRAFLAYHAKLGGYSLGEIAERYQYPSADAVRHDIARHLKEEVRRTQEELRDSMLAMELDRLDYLQSRVWPQCEYGELKAVETALKIIQTRMKLLGLDAINTSTSVNTVLVVGGEEQDYITKLKRAAGEVEG